MDWQCCLVGYLGFGTKLLDTSGWCGLYGSGKVVAGPGPVL